MIPALVVVLGSDTAHVLKDHPRQQQGVGANRDQSRSHQRQVDAQVHLQRSTLCVEQIAKGLGCPQLLLRREAIEIEGGRPDHDPGCGGHRGVTALDSDIYIAQFANGSAEWRIGVRNGTITKIALGPSY